MMDYRLLAELILVVLSLVAELVVILTKDKGGKKKNRD